MDDQIKELLIQWIIANLEKRNFKTGSRGFGAYGKATIADRRYQIAVNVVEIGSGK